MTSTTLPLSAFIQNSFSGNGKLPHQTVACSIVHVVPGRVRFRVTQLAQDAKYAKLLQRSLEGLAGVSQVRVNPTAASVVITYTGMDGEIRLQLTRMIQDSLKLSSPDWGASQLVPTEPVSATIAPSKPESFRLIDLSLPVLATILSLVRLRLPIPEAIVAGMVGVTAFPVAKRATQSLVQDRKFNIDCLDLLAITATAIQRNWLTPALLMLLHTTGDAIRDRTARASASQAASLLGTLSHYAWIEKDGEVKQIPVTEVQVGDTVIVYPGEQIPVDGKVITGEASIDQQSLTGESMPVVRHSDELVFAATLVRAGKIHIKTERTGVNTRAGASIELIKKAPVYDTRIENYAETVADKAILPTLAIAAGTWAFTRDFNRVASILTLDFVTGIRLSIPTTFLTAINHAARHGILFRSGRALEQLAKVDTIIFDKTGTLTQGNLQIVAVIPVCDRTTPDRLLQLAAAAEQRITHPLAEAIVQQAESQGLSIPARRDVKFEVGLGVRSYLDSGEEVLVGSQRFLQQDGISTDGLIEQSDSSAAAAIYVACNQEFIGVLKYADPLRPDAHTVLQKLQIRYGMETQMLTGDNQTHAIFVARELGMVSSEVHAEAFPEVKAQLVRRLHDAGKTVAFVGDGLNDAIALAYADVSVSFAGGSEVARETADVVLMNDDLWSLLDAVAIAKETQAITTQNIGLSVIPNVAAIGLATTLGLNPLIAALIHNGSAIAAGVNGLRPLFVHRYTETQKMREAQSQTAGTRIQAQEHQNTTA